MATKTTSKTQKAKPRLMASTIEMCLRLVIRQIGLEIFKGFTEPVVLKFGHSRTRKSSSLKPSPAKQLLRLRTLGCFRNSRKTEPTLKRPTQNCANLWTSRPPQAKFFALLLARRPTCSQC
jgi:hypothetical protein